ncbi:hypothetical protein GCM10010502_00860 [Kitasatospora aureofaciens]|uniref:Uncharacterized protein n=1 Tax=Kitasatospora aureofaciens TaxID=1894 RepID=A0A8H9HFG3_KITAU|nr:hypothetical protein GCM10010502_00860 [Kitasatospora aureofaciens]
MSSRSQLRSRIRADDGSSVVVSVEPDETTLHLLFKDPVKAPSGDGSAPGYATGVKDTSSARVKKTSWMRRSGRVPRCGRARGGQRAGPRRGDGESRRPGVSDPGRGYAW